MRYQGGKSRIAKQISKVIKNEIPRRQIENFQTDSRSDKEQCVLDRESNLTLVSLFCGSCSVESKLTFFTKKILNDKQLSFLMV